MSNYVLYGAASIGGLVLEKIQKVGNTVIGFIDKRAYEIGSYHNIPVWSIEEAHNYVPESIIVYIAVKNVFEHEKIVRSLSKKGFDRFVYKPYNTLLGCGNSIENIIAELYDKIFNGEPIDETGIPLLSEIHGNNFHDFGLISESNDRVTAFIPVEYVFTNIYKDTPMEKWGDINISAFFTHINFFRFQAGFADGDIEAYLKEYCEFTANLTGNIKITNAWRENVINNRAQIYEQMLVASELDRSFFFRNAPTATWNDDKKHFNLTSGKHRCTFLVAMKHRFIPLNVPSTDYNEFLNLDSIKLLKQLSEDSDYKQMIPHPYFYRGGYTVDNGCFQTLLFMARFFGKKTYELYNRVLMGKVHVIDYLSGEGEYARFLSIIGCNVRRARYPLDFEFELNKILFSKINYIEKYPYNENDILLILSDEKTDVDLCARNKTDKTYLLCKGWKTDKFKPIFIMNYYEEQEIKSIVIYEVS